VPKQRLIVWSVLEDGEGKLWLGTSSGLIKWTSSETNNQQPRIYTEANGLSHNSITALCTDREGNLWVGSEGGGAMRLVHSGFITYNAEDHLGFKRFTGVNATLVSDRRGDVFPAFHHVIDVLRGNKFKEIIPAIPRQHTTYLGWGWHQTIVQDKTGEWWIPTGEGLVRFPSVTVDALERTPPKAVYTTRDGLRTNDIFRVFEDRSGGIWMACIGPGGINGLSRWDRRTGSLHNFTEHTVTVATAFAEDHDGTIWIGYYNGTLGRFRAGAFQFYSTEDGLTGGGIQALHVDRAGRLWIASLGGVVRVDEPARDRPHFTRFGTKDGLSSNIALCIAEDRWGRIYLATAHGIDRISAGGRIAPPLVRHYTQADGLAKGGLRDLLFDRNGVLWCASKQGISRLLPEPEDSRRPPSPVFIRRVRVRGIPLENLEGAEGSILKLTHNQNQLQIDFAGLAFTPGDALRYQYKLDPADSDWSDPSAERTVNYSSLAPGSYQFKVRLIRDGLLDGDPAVLRFAIQAPVWQRWWFRLLIALSAAVIVYRLHRYRILRVLELERVRTRIATDLHDDIGSALSQIAVLTEVAQMRIGEDKSDLKETLSRIGSVSRDLSESMSDIVWSVNPQRDRLSDLVQRMRRFSSDVFSRGSIDFRFRSSVPEQAVHLAADLRREVYLIFKEAVNNVVRHSNCTRAEISISIDNGCLELLVEDNGTGFCERGIDMGNGLSSMRERARRMGAGFEISGLPGSGVRVVLQVPMRS
jgi:signal transduction histidine kinase/streptogramin lyase